MGIEALLRPRSVAIVGASDKVGPGLNAWNALREVGFAGPVHLVNPSRDEVLGQRAYSSLRDLPGPVDAVFIAVSAAHAVAVLGDAAAIGAGGAAILSSGFGEAGDAGRQAQRDLVAMAQAHGIAVCGPNCLGLLNLAGRSALFGTSLPDELPRGGVAAVVQSGSVGIALLNARRIGLSHLVTSGNEAVTTAADFLEALVEDPEVRVLVAFLEQLRRPAKFLAVAERARTLGKPLIVLKSGRSEAGQRAVMAHTGAVAGSEAVCAAALRSAGIVTVASLDELVEAALLASTLRRRPARAGAALLSLSGGEIALALDAAAQAKLELPAPQAAAAPLAALLPPFAHIANPLDLTWAGLYDPEVAKGCVRAFAGEPAIGLLALLQDAPEGLGTQQAQRYAALLDAVAEAADAAQLPLVAISNLSGGLHPRLAAVAAARVVPYLRGTEPALRALAGYLRWAARSGEATRRVPAIPPLPLPLPFSGVPSEHAAGRFLAAHGIPRPAEALAPDAAACVAAAEAIGFPVVLKGMVPGLVHKSDAGLVALGLGDAAAVHRAAAGIAARAKGALEGFLVQRMVTGVAELFLGARVDAEFGPVVALGPGGTEIELLEGVAIRLAPVDAAEARAMLAETRAARLLGGWRGKPAGDVDAVAAAVAALSRLIVALADEAEEIEVNPLAVLPQGEGCLALDAVIVPRARVRQLAGGRVA
jgi:acyl-CoA synthetase (NDP forming)